MSDCAASTNTGAVPSSRIARSSGTPNPRAARAVPNSASASQGSIHRCITHSGAWRTGTSQYAIPGGFERTSNARCVVSTQLIVMSCGRHGSCAAPSASRRKLVSST